MVWLVARLHGVGEVEVFSVPCLESADVRKVIPGSFDAAAADAVHFVPDQRGEVVALVRCAALEGVEAVHLVDLFVPLLHHLQRGYFVEFGEVEQFVGWAARGCQCF